MAEEKVEVELNGKKFRIPKHMMKDFERFGASQTKRLVKEPPQELTQVQPKKIILPPKEELPKTDILPEMVGDIIPQEIKLPEKKQRKKPVRSKSKSK